MARDGWPGMDGQGWMARDVVTDFSVINGDFKAGREVF